MILNVFARPKACESKGIRWVVDLWALHSCPISMWGIGKDCFKDAEAVDLSPPNADPLFVVTAVRK